MNKSRILIILFTIFCIIFFTNDIFINGISIVSFLVFISSAIIFFDLTFKTKPDPRIKLKRGRLMNKRNILDNENNHYQPMRKLYLGQWNDHFYVSPDEHTLSNYEKKYPTDKQSILDYLREKNN